MAAKIPREGQIPLLTELISAGENWNLNLFKTSITPAVTDTLSTYTAQVATFTGYSQMTLTRTQTGSTWGAAAGTGTTIDAGGNAKAIYHSGTPQTWSATSAQTIYGHYLSGATSGKLILAELWGSSVSLINPSTLNLTPVLELGSD
jgi:hypothetical protein